MQTCIYLTVTAKGPDHCYSDVPAGGGVAQVCTWSEDDYEYYFFDPPPGFLAPGTYDLDDPNCPVVHATGKFIIDFTFLDSEPGVVGHTSRFNGLPVVDGAIIPLEEHPPGLQTVTLTLNYVSDPPDHWTFRFSTLADVGLVVSASPAPVLPGGATSATVTVTNHRSQSIPLHLTTLTPSGWDVAFASDNGPVIQSGQSIQTQLLIAADRNLPLGVNDVISFRADDGDEHVKSVTLYVSTGPVNAGRAIPTLSEWGLAMLTTLLFALGGHLVFVRNRGLRAGQ